jgi:hypothetical protein
MYIKKLQIIKNKYIYKHFVNIISFLKFFINTVVNIN